MSSATGEVSGTITAADVIRPAGHGIEPANIAELIAAMQAGVTYRNVHTSEWPTGDIRGQINGDDDD